MAPSPSGGISDSAARALSSSAADCSRPAWLRCTHPRSTSRPQACCAAMAARRRSSAAADPAVARPELGIVERPEQLHACRHVAVRFRPGPRRPQVDKGSPDLELTDEGDPEIALDPVSERRVVVGEQQRQRTLQRLDGRRRRGPLQRLGTCVHEQCDRRETIRRLPGDERVACTPARAVPPDPRPSGGGAAVDGRRRRVPPPPPRR